MAEDYTPSLLQSSKPEVKAGTYSDYSQDSLYKARGGAKDFDANKYRIDQHSYPDDLMDPNGQYGSNYVVFYINIANDSKLTRDPSVNIVEDDTPRDRGELIAQVGNNEQLGQILSGASPILGSAILGGRILSEPIKTTGGISLGVTGVKSQASNFTAQTKRLKTAIALHMPNQMGIRYAVNYDEVDTLLGSVIGTGVAGSAETANAIKQALQKGGGLDDVTDILTGRGGAGAAALGLSVPGTELAQKLTGLAPNPRREQVFRNVDFRTFQLDYQFFPRSKEEADNVKNIIKEFKLHMHPEYKDTNAFLYVYPSEFDIFYYHGTQENLNVHRHTSCVLTEMNVNYTPQGRFNAFDDGTPAQINMVLTFKELAPLTKERIQDGL